VSIHSVFNVAPPGAAPPPTPAQLSLEAFVSSAFSDLGYRMIMRFSRLFSRRIIVLKSKKGMFTTKKWFTQDYTDFKTVRMAKH
jgi:hypothetical protein